MKDFPLNLRKIRQPSAWIGLVGGVLFAISVQSEPFWPQFRGPTGQGIAPSARPPVSFTQAEALWSSQLPPGHSSPCVWGERIFLTTFADGKLECRAYARGDGKLVWSRPVAAEKIELTHPFNNPAAPTPAADAERVVFYFGSYGLLAFTHDGRPVWEKKLPPPVSRGNYGSSSSPVLCGDLIIQAADTDEGGSRLLAFNRATGEKSWEAARPLFSCGWSTPVVWTRGGKSEIVLLGSKKLTAYEPANGRELWSVPGFPLETAPSPSFNDEQVFACSAGMGGRSNPKFEGSGWTDLMKFDSNKDGKIQFGEVPEDYLLVQRPELPEGSPGRLLPFPVKGMLEGMDKDKDGAVSHEEWDASLAEFEQIDTPVVMALNSPTPGIPATNLVAWQSSRGIPEVPSPLCYQGKLYLLKDGGVLQCLDAKTGAVLYQERLGVPGGYSASPVAAQDQIYLASQSGTITVVDSRSATLKVLARNALGERITATPAIVGDRLYLRTEKHLIAFGSR